MQNVLDSVQIVLCGGRGVGKTTLLSRLACQKPPQLIDDVSINSIELTYPLNNSSHLKIGLYAIGSRLIDVIDQLAQLKQLLARSSILIMVIDGTDSESLKDMDSWLNTCSQYFSSAMLKYLVVNKADLFTSKTAILSEENFDTFVRAAGFLGWSYSVGSPWLGDFSVVRAPPHRQQTIESIIVLLLHNILQKRSSTFYKLFPVPPRFHLVSWLTAAAAQGIDEA
jgi:GTPase SAR1 family protein